MGGHSVGQQVKPVRISNQSTTRVTGCFMHKIYSLFRRQAFHRWTGRYQVKPVITASASITHGYVEGISNNFSGNHAN